MTNLTKDFISYGVGLVGGLTIETGVETAIIGGSTLYAVAQDNGNIGGVVVACGKITGLVFGVVSGYSATKLIREKTRELLDYIDGYSIEIKKKDNI